MSMTRRGALGVLAGTTASLLAPGGRSAGAQEAAEDNDSLASLLYDGTRCIGCQTCVVACREASGLPYENPGDLHDAAPGLTGRTKTVIKLHREGQTYAYTKRQCLHCLDPACASACMLGAFAKRDHGIVTWDGTRCIGCRYCQIACPFNVPRFQWDRALPEIVKCDMCYERVQAGGQPACTEVCPRGAVVFGTREELLTEAHRRIDETPGRYNPKVYGESDAGGTQVLVMAPAGIHFSDLGLPDLGDDPAPHLAETVQHGIYQGFVAPVALYALLGVAVWRSQRAQGKEEDSPADEEVRA
jgi:Fe-S-cluster-containing dehydrogenase component